MKYCKLIAMLALLLGAGTARSQGAPLPVGLKDVPPDSIYFFHADVKSILKSPLVQEVRKGLGDQLQQAMEAAKAQGIDIEKLSTVTFSSPNFTLIASNAENNQFLLTLQFQEAYDKSKLFVDQRAGEEKDNAIPLKSDMLLRLVDSKTVQLTNKKMAAQKDKGKPANSETDSLADFIQESQKHQLCMAINLSGLPDEIRKNPAEELRPFLPIFNAQNLGIFADATQGLKVNLKFHCENADKAETVKGSLNLAGKIASKQIELVQNSKSRDLEPLLPALKIIKKGIDEAKIQELKNEVSALVEFQSDIPLGSYLKGLSGKMLGNSSRTIAVNNLKQIALAMHNYASVYDGFPPGAICDRKGKKLLSWRVAILPYVDQTALYAEFKLDEPWDSEHNKKLIAKMPRVYRHPSDDPKTTKTRYKIFTGNGACFDVVKATKFQEITDGTSNTLMCVTAAEPVEWTKPDDIEYDKKVDVLKLLFWEDGSTPISLCDGSVRSVSTKLKLDTLHLLIQKADGQVIGPIE
ncbi:DUF1559 domain-containing protein [Telmatocola sphagniphila]|uniref:DUF1559 domain-containing protein n=1 Tax=Telmatocola sphagniphila TaxID=1123043 RepID=A0A8E6EVL7_9BACT|nr:DUF1559 domain-containing protein [Telmatocola sphagniphila]QVL32905.1 DUF1559 domain-containing protein [Telmatocola sphagniphila]